MNEEQLMELIATLDQRLKVVEEWMTNYMKDITGDGVYMDGMPEYVREYFVKPKKEGE